MGSESLFVKCNKCGKDISKNARHCHHCGMKQKKLSIVHWIGIILATIFIIGLINEPNSLRESSSSSNNYISLTENQSDAILIPPSQKLFINIIEKYIKGFHAAKNELQQSSLRDQRKKELAELIHYRSASSWVGTIFRLETTTDGKATLSIRVTPDIEIKTWNNSFSDIDSNTLIEKGSPLYNSLFDLSHGQQVEFSGSFFRSNTDYFEETSMTIQGAMTNPEFLFKFQSVKLIN